MKKEGVTMIEMTIIILFSLSILLFILSFFRKDRTEDIEKQIEELSITYMQEMYQLKKKIRHLEEELLIQHTPSPFQAKSSSQQRLVKEVIAYYEQGDQIEVIAKKTGLTSSEVARFLQPYLGDDEVSKL